MNIQIETTTVCNAACAFCVHKTMKRSKMHMQQSVFEKTISDVKRIEPLEGVCLTGLGETLLDPLIIERLEIVRKELGNVPLTIFTNGTNLDKYLPDLLRLEVNNIMISANALKIYNGVWLDAVKKSNEKTKITVSLIVDWGMMDMCDVEEMKKAYPPENFFLHLVGNWTGKIFDLKFKPTRACHRPFNFAHVLVDGRVALCCFDSEGDVILGNDLIEALAGDKLKFYQEMMASGKRFELPLCGNCSTI